jgi:putative flippase GtrA
MRSIASAIQRARSLTSEEQRKFAKFVLVGGFKTVSAYGVYLLLLWCGLHYNLALVGDYIFGILVGYGLNRSWTFADQGRAQGAFLKYVSANVLAFVINALALNLAVGFGMGPAIGQIPSLAIATIASYLLQRHYVFTSRR